MSDAVLPDQAYGNQFRLFSFSLKFEDLLIYFIIDKFPYVAVLKLDWLQLFRLIFFSTIYSTFWLFLF